MGIKEKKMYPGFRVGLRPCNATIGDNSDCFRVLLYS